MSPTEQVSRGNGTLADLTQFFYTLGADDLLKADRSWLYKVSDSAELPMPRIACGDAFRKAKQLSQGLTAVREIIARSIGGNQAERITQQVLGQRHRYRGWTSLWMWRDKPLTRKQFKDILDDAYVELGRQLLKRDIDERLYLLSRAYPTARTFRDLAGGQHPPLALEQVLQDPLLSEAFRALAGPGHAIASIDFLNACDRYDELVLQAVGFEAKLKRRNMINADGSLNDSGGAHCVFNEQHQPVRIDGHRLRSQSLLENYSAAIEAVRENARFLRNSYFNQNGVFATHLPHHLTQQVNNQNIDEMGLNELKNLFGSSPSCYDDEYVAGARFESLTLLKNTYQHVLNSLRETTLQIGIKNLGASEGQLDLILNDLVMRIPTPAIPLN